MDDMIKGLVEQYKEAEKAASLASEAYVDSGKSDEAGKIEAVAWKRRNVAANVLAMAMVAKFECEEVV
jgi:hypothetical protein